MADVESRSESPLSDIGSDAFTEEKFHKSQSPSHMSAMSDAESEGSATHSISTPRTMESRPPKRRRLLDGTEAPPARLSDFLEHGSPAGSISSDSSGSVPTSPSFAHLGPTHPLSTYHAATQANPNDPESADYVQVSVCQWDGCAEPDQGNMDNLVDHITDVHIPPKQKKYFCEWEGCSRKSMPHTSAYALKAHMRSHTKEKPFMCQVPECDRSFTRSDALAKHMRTVHETEALRPSDPVPRGHSGGIAPIDSKANGTSTNGTLLRKLKLTFKGGKKSSTDVGVDGPKVEGGIPPLPTVGMAQAAGVTSPRPAQLEPEENRDEILSQAVHMDSLPFRLPVGPNYYPQDVYVDMESYECDLPPSQWFRLLRRQLRWAMEDSKALDKELGDLQAKTDDLRGNPVTKPIPRFDEVGDSVKRDEWAIVENLLDRIAGAEYLGSTKSLVTSGGLADDGGVHADDTSKALEKVRSLPYWQRSQQNVEETVSVAGATA